MASILVKLSGTSLPLAGLVCTCNDSHQKAEAGGWWVLEQTGYTERSYHKQNTIKNVPNLFGVQFPGLKKGVIMPFIS